MKEKERKQQMLKKRQEVLIYTKEQQKKEQKEVNIQMLGQKLEEARAFYSNSLKQKLFTYYAVVQAKSKQQFERAVFINSQRLKAHLFKFIVNSALLIIADKEYLHSKMVSRFQQKKYIRLRVQIIDLLKENLGYKQELTRQLLQRLIESKLIKMIRFWKSNVSDLFQERTQLE